MTDKSFYSDRADLGGNSRALTGNEANESGYENPVIIDLMASEEEHSNNPDESEKRDNAFPKAAYNDSKRRDNVGIMADRSLQFERAFRHEQLRVGNDQTTREASAPMQPGKIMLHVLVCLLARMLVIIMFTLLSCTSALTCLLY
jgi:hypothetical protein